MKHLREYGPKWGLAVMLASGLAMRVCGDPVNPEQETLPATESAVLGQWTGYFTRDAVEHHVLTVKRSGERLTAQDLVYGRLSHAQAIAATENRLSSTGLHPFAFVSTETYDVEVASNTVTLTGHDCRAIWPPPEPDAKPWPMPTLKTTLTAPGILAGALQYTNEQPCLYFRLAKNGALSRPSPLNLERGVTHRLSCLNGGPFHYTCYLPRSYNPAQPTPILINDSPSGNADPLSTQMAEELGWIMVGLTESRNGMDVATCQANRGNVMTTFFDVRRRFNLDLRRVYFAGFSGGARVATSWANYFPENVAGVVCIGAGFAQESNGRYLPPPAGIPVFFIVGQTDMNHKEVTGLQASEAMGGRHTSLIVHPGGHTWGRADDHSAALRWLDQQSRQQRRPEEPEWP